MFTPKFHGSIFNISYGFNEAQIKAFTNCHLITSLKYFEILSYDWKSVLLKVDVENIEKVTNKNKLVLLEMKSTSKFPLLIFDAKTEKHLFEALNIIYNIPNPEIRFLALSSILPTFKFPDRSKSIALHKDLMDLSKELLTIFKPAEVYKSFTTSVNGALVDLLSCGYRMRYGDGERGIGKAQSFSIEIQHHIIRMWLKSLIRASESTDSKTNDLFYSRLSGSILDTISLLSNRISLSCDDLFTGNENDSNLNTLISSSKKVIEELDKMDEEDFEADSPYNTEYLGLLMDIIVVGISGIVVGMYQIDIDDLAEKVVNFVKALVTNSKETSALKISMEKSCKSYLTEMLRYLDGHRFESDFQFVYCTWDVMKSE